MNFTFAHFNFNVVDIKKSLQFYQEALGLHVAREHHAEDGSFHLVYLEDEQGHFQLELTQLTQRKEPYDLGECEFHLAFVTADFQQARQHHQQMDVICFDNPEMGIYFIEDPDGYWIEIVPTRK